MQQVFPDFAIKQTFHEAELERSDDAIISSMQNELVTRCLTSVLKGAIVSCTLAKRKYISDKDIKYGLSTTIWPVSSQKAEDVGGYILDTRAFGKFCSIHIDHIIELMQKHGVDVSDIKISSETILSLQVAVERLIRGFVQRLQQAGKKNRCYGFRLFDEVMRQTTGDMLHDASYVPYRS